MTEVLESRKRIIAEYERLCKITPQELAREQLLKLQFLVTHHYLHNPIYRAMLDLRGVQPSDIKTLSDIRKLPIVTTKDILTHGDAFFTLPQKNATFLYTSGSTGQSKIIPVAEDEKNRVFSNVALANYILGIRGDGVNYCAFPCGPWPSSFYSQNGAELVSPTVRADMRLPMEWHLAALKRFKPTSIMASPAFISYLGTNLSSHIDLKTLGVRTIKLCGEPFGENFRSKVETLFGAEVRDLYGCAELGPASAECHFGKGKYHHILAHEIIMETRKSGTENEILGYGESGELIVTPLFKTSLPLIRYNMKDIVSLNDPTIGAGADCPCGLQLPTMSRIEGRTDDMMTYGGANVYADMFYSVLDALHISDKFQAVMRKDAAGMRDQMVIKIEYAGERSAAEFSNDIEKGLRALSAELDYVFSNNLVNKPIIEILPFGELYKATAKLKRFIDERTAGASATPAQAATPGQTVKKTGTQPTPMLTAQMVIDALDREARAIDTAMHEHPVLGAILRKQTSGIPQSKLADAYIRWLKVTSCYVAHTVPMLKATAAALALGDDDDKKLAAHFTHYADEEYDHKEKYGHEAWAINDMTALGASPELIAAIPPMSTQLYGSYFVHDAHLHPHAIRGAKGVLEHLSITNSAKFEEGLRACGIQNIENAMQFIRAHGILDIEHVKASDEVLKKMTDPAKLRQILHGAYFTSGSYRAFLAWI